MVGFAVVGRNAAGRLTSFLRFRHPVRPLDASTGRATKPSES
jgi:hypothetical protein